MEIVFKSKEIGAKEGYTLHYNLDPSRINLQANSVITEWEDIQTLVELQMISVSSNSPDVNADLFLESWKSSSSTKGKTATLFKLTNLKFQL